MKFFSLNVDDNYKNIIKVSFFLLLSLSLIIKGIAGLLFFGVSLLGIIFFINRYKTIIIKKHEILLIILLMLNLMVIIFNQISNFSFNLRDYDYGIRFILSIFIYIIITRLEINLKKEICFGIILSIIFVAISYIFLFKNEIFNVRTHTSFVDPNTISVYLSIFLLIVLPLNNKQNYLFKISLAIVCFVACFLIIESQSRGGWLGLFLGLLFIFIYSLKDNNFKALFIIFCIFLFFIFYYFYNDSFNLRFNTISLELYERLYGNPNSSTGDRITLTFLGLDMLQNHYLFGINYNSSREIIESLELYKNYQAHIFDIFYCCGFHNQYTTILVKYGILGLISFLSLFVYLAYLNLKYFNNYSTKIIAVLIAFMVASLSLETISLKYTQSIFLILLVYGYSITFLHIESLSNAK